MWKRLCLLPLLATCSLTQYVTRPDIIPAFWNISYTAPGANISNGYIFLSQRVLYPSSLTIYTPSGDLVYFYTDYNLLNASNGAFNFRPQTLNGEAVLTYWEGWAEIPGYGQGHSIVLANNYTVLANVSATNGSDFHESRITKNGSIVVTEYTTLGGIDTSGIVNGTTSSYIQNGCFQQLSLPNGTVEFTFCSYEAGIGVDESFLPITSNISDPLSSWDYIHVNNVDMDSIGNYLLSGRHTHTLYYISGQNGSIIWRLGGKETNFTGNGTHYSWQHNALFAFESNLTSIEVQNATTRYISLFDNASDGTTDTDQSASNGLIIELDLQNMTASVMTNYTTPGGETNLLATSQGSVEVFGSDSYTPLDSTNVFVGYGELPVFAEFDMNGTALQVTHWGNQSASSQSYRTYKATWNGYPVTSPDVAINNSTLYMSWNGATEVAYWQVIQGNDTSIVPKQSFESNFTLQNANATDLIQVVAFSSSGVNLASSPFLMPNGTLTGNGAINGTGTAPVSTSNSSNSTSTSSSPSSSSSFSSSTSSPATSMTDSNGVTKLNDKLTLALLTNTTSLLVTIITMLILAI